VLLPENQDTFGTKMATISHLHQSASDMAWRLTVAYGMERVKFSRNEVRNTFAFTGIQGYFQKSEKVLLFLNALSNIK
jgi:hypothetical protein